MSVYQENQAPGESPLTTRSIVPSVGYKPFVRGHGGDAERKYNKSRVTLGLHGFAMLGSLLGLRRRLGIVWRLGEVYGMYLLRRGGLGLGIEDVIERSVVVFPLSR